MSVQGWHYGRRARQKWAGFCWSWYYNMLLRAHPGVTLAGPLRVTGRMHWELDARANVTIGRGVRLNSGSLVNAVGGHRPMIIAVLAGARLELHDGAGLSSSTLVCHDCITIGRDVLVGGDCCIYDSDFHSLLPEERRQRPDPGVRKAPVTIGERAFIGSGSMLLKGVSVGAEAVVGAGSVVVKSVPASEIWAGNPARFLRRVREPDSALR